MIPLASTEFFFGVVENANDPSMLGRVQVRILGAHTSDTSLIPTASLPWANVMLPTTTASISGIGISPTGIVEGTLVCGIFIDGGFRQQPLVMGTLSGSRSTTRSPQTGFNDPNGLYPLTGVTGDVNPLATGNTSASQQMTDKNTNRIQTLGVDSDPTVKPVVQNASTYSSAPWMPIATTYLGINNKDNPDVIQTFLAGSGVSSSNIVAWCAAFANFVLAKAGIQGTRSAMARSFVGYGVSVGTTNIPYGAIAVFQGSRGPSSGHVGFVVKDLGTKVSILGGNQTLDQSTGTLVSYADNGGQVTQVNFPKTNLIGCYFPTNLNSLTNTQ